MAKFLILSLFSFMLNAHQKSHPIPLNGRFLEQLSHRGIELTFNMPFCPNAQTPKSCEGGVLFITDFKTKEEVLQKWLELYSFRPSKVVSTYQK